MAYVELFFHTNQAAVDWFQGPGDDPNATGGWNASPAVGAAVDDHLGRPRSSGGTDDLDAVPGFGTTADTMLRDETIAYWEAFRRQLLIAECMAAAGFSYSPAVAFPAQDAAAVAESLGVDADGQTATSSSSFERNRRYEAGLSDSGRDHYVRTLLGESAADVDAVNETGIVPAGRAAATFAAGGCVGAAAVAVPSIWDAPRALAVFGPDAADAGAGVAGGAAALLDAQQARYAGVMSEIEADDALAAHLAAAIVR